MDELSFANKVIDTGIGVNNGSVIVLPDIIDVEQTIDHLVFKGNE